MLRRAAVRYVRGDTAESSRLTVSQICCENDVSVPAQSDLAPGLLRGTRRSALTGIPR